MAADSLSSGGAAGLVAGTAKKVFALEELPLIWTASGAIYVIEEVDVALRQLEKDVVANTIAGDRAKFDQPDLDLVRQRLTNRIRTTMKACYQDALPLGMHQGQTLPPHHHPFESEFLVLGYTAETPYFLHVSEDGSADWVHPADRFRAVGSGQDFASVAGALMKHHIREELTVEGGLKLAYRAVDATCRISTMYVRPPVQLAVADNSGARVLSQEEHKQVEDEVQGWLTLEQETLTPLDVPPAEPPKFEAG